MASIFFRFIPTSMLTIRPNADADNRFLCAIQEMRGSESEFIDAEIIVNSRRIHGHKVILAAHSRFLKEEFQNTSTVYLDQLDYDSVAKLVDYFYTKEMVVGGLDEAKSLLRAILQLRVASVQSEITSYIMQHLDTNNCIDWFLFASGDSEMSPIRQRAREIMSAQLPTVVQTSAFLELQYHEMMEYLCGERENAQTQILLGATFRWMDHDVTSRKCKVGDILHNIPLDRCPPGMLKYIMENYGDTIITEYTILKSFMMALLAQVRV